MVVYFYYHTMFISSHGPCNGVILEFCSGVLSQHLPFFLQVWSIVSKGENKNKKIINQGANLTIFRKGKPRNVFLLFYRILCKILGVKIHMMS